MCIESVCEGISTFYYANSPWTLVSMKIIKIGMTCKVVYFSLYIPLLCNCISKKIISEQCFIQDSLFMNMGNIVDLYLIFYHHESELIYVIYIIGKLAFFLFIVSFKLSGCMMKTWIRYTNGHVKNKVLNVLQEILDRVQLSKQIFSRIGCGKFWSWYTYEK